MYITVVLAATTIFLTVNSSSISQSTSNQDYSVRRVLFRRGDIDFDKLPDCAKPYCNASDSLSPSRLGCVGPSLTKSCLCDEAVTPLECVPNGPSSEDNCWYNVEDWFAGICNNSVPQVAKNSMPSCMADCATNWFRTKGCKTDTRNCFCKLDRSELVKFTEQCRRSSCMKHMIPAFDVAFWADQICSQGEAGEYNEAGYKSRKKMVRNVRIVVPIFLLAILIPVVLLGVFRKSLRGFGVHQASSIRNVRIVVSIGAICIAALVLIPIYVAI
jgi:hypothetical protein